MKPSKIYAEVLEPSALEQYDAVMALPDVVQGALMPDAHTGYVLPIGAVVATIGTIYPSFVGYDIGCGMCAVNLDLNADLVYTMANTIQLEIMKRIPVGFAKNNQAQEKLAKDYPDNISLPFTDNISCHIPYGPKCLGTLGGGNHFIEIGKDDTDNSTWIIIHSGSRSLGHATAEFYMKAAAEQYNDERKAETASALDVNSELGKQYIIDMNYCLEFALMNRRLMITIVIDLMDEIFGRRIPVNDFINRNHNHAELVNGRWIHRKGATHADAGMYGVIPGNMRDGSFIVLGKGNPDSMNSSSHGAGRVMSRNQAKKRITLEEFKASMINVPAANVDVKRIDESPMSYKNIYEVMDLQKDLIQVITHVTPIVNVKG